jgi:hypothetical protein
MIIEHLTNLFFYSSFGFFMSCLLFFVLAGLIEPGERNKTTVRRLQDAAGLNLSLMVLSVVCWAGITLLEMWWVG